MFIDKLDFLENGQYHNNKKLDIKNYFQKQYDLCKELKSTTQDPTSVPESKLSQSMEQKLAVILEAPIIIPIIRKWQHLQRNEMVLKVMYEIMDIKDLTFEKRINLALKTALGILTEGVVSAPRDGLLEVKIDPENFIRIILAGPIRAAGGSLMGMIICYAQLLRRQYNIGEYKATQEEIDKVTAEVSTYLRIHPSQVIPSVLQISHVVQKSPIMIDGIETELEVVPYNKTTPRLPHGKLRGGACLAIVEGLIIRVKKIQSALKKLGLEWQWLGELKNLGSKSRTKGQRKIKDTRYTLSIGRPLISTSENTKGLRIRIGKAPTNGLCGVVVSPELIDLLRFLNIGTQLVLSEPGKGCTITGTSNQLQKPIVKYKDESLDYYECGRYQEVTKILDLGEILCNLGDFIEFKTTVKERDYDSSLWAIDTLKQVDFNTLNEDNILTLNKHYENVKLHPYYSLFLKDLEYKDYLTLRMKWNKEYFEYNSNIVRILETLCCPYYIKEEKIYPKYPKILSHHLLHQLEIDTFEFYNENDKSLLQSVNNKLREHKLIPIGEKGFFTITARIGRPENISLSKMKPQNAYSLANYRPSKYTEKFWSSIQKQPLSSSRCLLRYCHNCDIEEAYKFCSNCSCQTVPVKYCLKCQIYIRLDNHDHENHKTRSYFTLYRNYYKEVSKILEKHPEVAKDIEKNKVKLVKGNIPYPEPIIKGLLRAKYQLPVTKDGTIGLNAGNASTTHFTPKMINTSIQKLRELGYHKDENGEDITDENQIIRLKFNDVIYPNKAKKILKDWANFIDDLLEYYYDSDRYYTIKKEEDLVGMLVVIIAPHISNGIVSRIIGFAENQSVYSHPLSVTTRRRDQDGDIDRTCLLMDCLLNCSRKYVSQNKIGALMSIPLTLSLDLKVNQTGKEILYCETFKDYSSYPILDNTKSYNIDAVASYPCYQNYLTNNIKEEEIDYNVSGMDISTGSLLNMYKDSENNEQKIALMLRVENLLTFVNNKESLEGLIEGHLYPDLRGNLNAYFRQAFRCSKCGKKESIDILSYKCLYCKNGDLKPTVYPNMVLKYVKILEDLVKNHDLDEYFRSKIKVVLEEAKVLETNDDKTNKFFNSFISRL